jgi:hypothetical protein
MTGYRDTSEGELAEPHHGIIDAAEKFAGPISTCHILIN